MHVGFLTILALQAASAVLAKPVPEDVAPDAAIDQLASLAQDAYDQAETDLSDETASKRDGTCTWSNIKVRREWLVHPLLVMHQIMAAN